jgi:hypothetical protein
MVAKENHSCACLSCSSVVHILFLASLSDALYPLNPSHNAAATLVEYSYFRYLMEADGPKTSRMLGLAFPLFGKLFFFFHALNGGGGTAPILPFLCLISH